MTKFTGKLLDWPDFRKTIEQNVMSSGRIADSLKFTLIDMALDGESLTEWKFHKRTSTTCHQAWQALVQHYQDPTRVFTHLTSLANEMPTIKDPYDHHNMRKLLMDLTAVPRHHPVFQAQR